jgi:hypothetical protein
MIEQFFMALGIYTLSISWGTTVQLLTILLEVGNSILTVRACGPLRKLMRERRVASLFTHKKMRWIQQRIVLIVGSRFVDVHLARQVGLQRQISSTVSQSVFLELDSRGQGLKRKSDKLVVPSGIW